MKSLAKLVFGSLVLTCAAFASAQPANAASGFGFSYGYGGYGGPPISVHYNPCYRPYYARPRYCNYPRYRGRVFFGGARHRGPFHYRDYYGGRQYWHRGRRHRGYDGHHGPRRGYGPGQWRGRY